MALETVVEALKDTSRTVREVARDLGYSRSRLTAIAGEQEITRGRGGDRKSPAARMRYERE